MPRMRKSPHAKTASLSKQRRFLSKCHWGSNPNQVSRLRMVNPGSEAALVRIAGVDDAGARPGGVVRVTVPAGRSRTLSALELETGEAAGVQGRLGDGWASGR